MRLSEPVYWIKERITPVDLTDSDSMNRMISEAIIKGKPFLAGKIGASELFAMRTVEFGYTWKRRRAFEQLRDWSGFFPLEQDREERFVLCMKEAINNADLLIHWNRRHQRYFVEKYGSNDLTCSSWFGCSFGEGKWGSALNGRKVLVVHPFEESIRKQHEVFEKVHKGSTCVPHFELQTIKALQTLGGVHDEGINSWEEGLKHMADEAEKKEFDVALVGCGAYGLPLASHIKKMGKTAVHLGGELQLMFGIMGNRWETNRGVLERKNEYWIRPDSSERPLEADKVENACYW